MDYSGRRTDGTHEFLEVDVEWQAGFLKSFYIYFATMSLETIHFLAELVEMLRPKTPNTSTCTLPSSTLLDNQRESGVHVRHVRLRRSGRSFI